MSRMLRIIFGKSSGVEHIPAYPNSVASRGKNYRILKESFPDVDPLEINTSA